MKNIIATILVAFACLMTTSSANAEPIAKATIPFDFTVGPQVLPAGTYVITQVSPAVIEIDSWTRLIHLRVGVIPADSVNQRPNRLVFHKYDDRYFLSEVRGGVGQFVSSFYPSRLEKSFRLERSAATQQTEEIAMK